MTGKEEYLVMIKGADELTCLYYAGDDEWYREGDLYKADVNIISASTKKI